MTAVAIIPPYAFTNMAMMRPLQMVLPACFESGTYRHAYEKRTLGYTILDNGMFESDAPISNQGLLEMARTYRVQEVVMPDVRGDAFATVTAIKQFFHDYTAWLQGGGTKFRLMAVVQGANADEREACLFELAGIVPDVTELVIGFPRRLTEESPDTRMDTMNQAYRILRGSCQFHMLGLSRQWPGEFLMAKQKFGDLLRGLDTDAPFVWAHYEESIRATAANAERPDNYFHLAEHEIRMDKLKYNMYVLDAWAQGLKAGYGT